MTLSQQAPPCPPSGLQLTSRVQELHHQLEGFPILDLLHPYVAAATSSAMGKDATRGFLIIQSCLSNWLMALDLAIEAHRPSSDEAHERLKMKQEQTRNALSCVRLMLWSFETQRMADTLQ